MKVILYMATSADGFIAKNDGDSDWVSEVDTKNFEGTINNAGCFIVGRKTFEQYEGDLYPMKDVLNVVLTNNEAKTKEVENVLFTNKSPQEVLKMLENKGFKEVVVIGGSTLNASFLKGSLIDEIYLSVHPLLLGNGMPIFRNGEIFKQLKLVGIKELKEGLLQLHYEIVR